MELGVRTETADDISAIHRVVAAAFGQTVEADLIDGLRAAGALTVSLIATIDETVVGHIAFSPVDIDDDEDSAKALGLGPLAVVPAHQNQGIGTGLVEAGLARCRDLGVAIVVVLGEPGYYGRFGFGPSVAHDIRWEHDAPADAFMVRELVPGALAGVRGTARYHAALDGV